MGPVQRAQKKFEQTINELFNKPAPTDLSADPTPTDTTTHTTLNNRDTTATTQTTDTTPINSTTPDITSATTTANTTLNTTTIHNNKYKIVFNVKKEANLVKYTNGKKTYFELDVWIPDLNIGFEYQVNYTTMHYTTNNLPNKTNEHQPTHTNGKSLILSWMCRFRIVLLARNTRQLPSNSKTPRSALRFAHSRNTEPNPKITPQANNTISQPTTINILVFE